MLTMSENACICTADLQKATAMKRKPTKTLKQLQKEETKEQGRKSPAKNVTNEIPFRHLLTLKMHLVAIQTPLPETITR